ncbi:MAG TPA: transposase [Kofleriaceae bacterium]
MARPRKRHVQQEMRFGDRRGGKRRRKGGRPRKGPRSSERHEKREAFRKNEPVHVVARVVDAVGELRTRQTYHAIRKALVTTFTRENFRIVHLSIQNTHVHLLVEAEHRTALSRGMQAFQISAAKHLNAAISTRRSQRRRGTVFADRYHAKIIRSPRQARNALAYVLNNWRKHREDGKSFARTWILDPFSSAVHFDGWRDYKLGPLPETYEPLPVWNPKCWLLKEGWRKHGLIATTEIPSHKVEVAAE